MRGAAIIAAGSALLAACGSDANPTTKATTAVYEATSEGRIEVARVNGVAIYGDCVATQVQALKVTKQEALEQCIDFELLAQAARDKGFLSHPSVVRTSRVESVRALIEDTYPMISADKITDADLRFFWNERGLKAQYNHDEGRDSRLCLTPLNKVSDPAVGEAIAREVYERLQKEETVDEGVFGRTCEAAANAHSKRFGIDVQFIKHKALRTGFQKAFGDALWALDKVNAYSPPTRAKIGWFVILLQEIAPPKHIPYEGAKLDIAERLMTAREAIWWRMGKFETWFDTLAKSHHIERYPERIPVGGL